MSISAPVRFSPDVETIDPKESETIAEVNTTFDTILKTTAADYSHAVRAVHAKAHGVLEGTLTVLPDLPPELAQGLFATPGEHRAWLRLSTNAGDILPDTISLPRGIALKVADVEGERLPGADGNAQDFVMVNGTVFQAPTTDKFLGNLKLLARTTDRMEGTKETMSAVLRGVSRALKTVGIESPKLQSLGGAPNVDPLGETYFSVTPFRYGDHIAKFSLAPASEGLRALTGTGIDASLDPDAIRHVVAQETAVIDMVWDLRVQLCRDLDKQPIEDPTVEWSEEDSPFQPVAVLRVPAQNGWDAGRVQAIDEEMRFSPWTGIAAHRPLGNINRARRDTYRHSADFRADVNRCPIHEPGAGPVG